jgi:enoyl-CoA hydratase/carnithine racemase
LELRFASVDARFRLPFVELGLAPEAGSSAALAPAVGVQEAAVLLFTGEWFDADHAQRIGLVWKTCAADALVDTTLKLASSIAAGPLVSLQATKALLLAARLEPVRAARMRELEVYARLLGGPANRRAVEALRSRSERAR